VAWVLGYFFSLIDLPFMLGEMLAGVILGPPLLGVISPYPAIELLAELGIFFVMFHTGMEMDPRELLEHIWPSLGVAIGGFILPFALGFLAAYLFGATIYQSLFMGLGVSVTAIPVQAVILNSMRINYSEVGHVIIGAAIANDILALIVLSTLLGPAETGSVDLGRLLIILLKAVVFFGGTILIGHYVMPRFSKRLTDKGAKAFTFAMVCALIMGYFAELAGLHLIIGAFLAGQFVRREVLDEKVYEVISDRFYGISYGFLVPIFFASLAFHLHFSWTSPAVIFTAILVMIAIIGKVVGCGLGAVAFGYSFIESAVMGVGMNGRGAIELVIATVVIKLSGSLIEKGLISAPLLTGDQFSALIIMAFITTLIAPISLKWVVTKACLPTEKASFCTLWAKSKGE